MVTGPTTASPAESDRLRWLDLVPVLAITIAGIVLVFLSLVALTRLDRSFYRANLTTIALSAALAVYLAFGAGLALALRRLRAPLTFLGLRRPTLADLGLVLVVLVPWYLGIVLVSALSAVLFNGGRPVPGNSTQLFVQHPRGIGILLMALLVSAVAAPICEETFFRGMLFRLLRDRLPFAAAVLLSAVAFGLAHASPRINLALLPVFIYMGVVLALVYARTRSLTTSILLHAANNAIGTVAVYTLLTR
jgi:CAAX protease family protein